jgi:hypothetical protein
VASRAPAGAAGTAAGIEQIESRDVAEKDGERNAQGGVRRGRPTETATGEQYGGKIYCRMDEHAAFNPG